MSLPAPGSLTSISWPSRKPLSSQLEPSSRISVAVILLIVAPMYVPAAGELASVSVVSETFET